MAGKERLNVWAVLSTQGKLLRGNRKAGASSRGGTDLVPGSSTNCATVQLGQGCPAFLSLKLGLI